MEYHVNRRVILSEVSEFRSLYPWSLQELDDVGKKIDADQIPWKWSLYFTASDLVLHDQIRIASERRDSSDSGKCEIIEREFITARLEPGDTSYSMFGTDRTISAFNLHIMKLEDDLAQEQCHAWGSVAYTSEVDFRRLTNEDIVEISLFVRPRTFARYAAKIASSSIHAAMIRLQGVAGFYSEWSPSVSTSTVKVLANCEDQKIEIPNGCTVDPPRLGEVQEAELLLQSLNELEGTFGEDWTEKGPEQNA